MARKLKEAKSGSGEESTARKRRVVKPAGTMREKIVNSEEPKRGRRIRESVRSTATSRASRVRDFGRKEYHPIKLPDNKVGRFLTKRRKAFPSFFGDAWRELKLVTWPDRSETTKLTVAVIIFAVIFGAIIAIVDYGLDKLFRNVILK